MKKQKSFFTLIEILVVIGIILILAGIILPAVNSAIKKADQTKAKAQITTLVNAIKQYEATYGHLPNAAWFVNDTEGNPGYNVIDNANYSDFIKMLQAEETTPTYNRRKQVFLDVVGNTPGEYKDPWGNDYHVVIDRGNTGKITSSPAIDGLDVPSTIYQSVIVWSNGAEDDNDASTKDDSKDNVYSFPVVWDKTAKEYKIGK